tara:strand:+ start:216 stop:530 length:315 start_codon:yes stop_codon:yes gene_type:complete
MSPTITRQYGVNGGTGRKTFPEALRRKFRRNIWYGDKNVFVLAMDSVAVMVMENDPDIAYIVGADLINTERVRSKLERKTSSYGFLLTEIGRHPHGIPELSLVD